MDPKPTLTEHFTYDELTQVGPHTDVVNDPPNELLGNAQKLASKLEEARAVLTAKLGRECHLRVTYGYRSPGPNGLNHAVGGSDTSAHMLFLGADTIAEGFTLREEFDTLVADPNFMKTCDQLVIERGCVHIGLPIPLHNNVPRHELRLDKDVNGVRTYPLYGIWTEQGVRLAEGN